MTDQEKREYWKKYRETHREQLARNQRKYYETHREQLARNHRKYYETNRERQRVKNMTPEQREARNAKKRKYYAEHIE